MKKNEVIQVNVVERIVVLTVIPGSYKMMVNDVKTVVGEIWRYPKNPKKNRFHSIPFSNIPTKSHNSKVSPMFFHGKPHGFPHPRPSPPVPRRLRHAAPGQASVLRGPEIVEAVPSRILATWTGGSGGKNPWGNHI